MISDAEIEATKVLEALEIRTVPVDVFAVARQEQIVLCPTKAGGDFCGRLEYSPEFGRFLLYYPETQESEASERIRFSVGHELGHYYLEHHRERLMLGHGSHNSAPGFICERSMELEADSFSSGILIPEHILKQRLKSRGFLTLEQILQLAADCQTSRESAAIRYIRYAEELGAVVVSQRGAVLYSISSDDAERVRFFVKRGSLVPGSSSAPKAISSKGIIEGEIAGSAWCEWSRIKSMTEESIALGYGGLVITILSKNSN